MILSSVRIKTKISYVFYGVDLGLSLPAQIQRAFSEGGEISIANHFGVGLAPPEKAKPKLQVQNELKEKHSRKRIFQETQSVPLAMEDGFSVDEIADFEELLCSPKKAPPPKYQCHICYRGGHYISDCPMARLRKINKFKGIALALQYFVRRIDSVPGPQEVLRRISVSELQEKVDFAEFRSQWSAELHQVPYSCVSA